MPHRLGFSSVPPAHLLELANLVLQRGHDLRAVLQQVTDTGTRLTGAQMGAFFYAAADEQGQRLDAFALSGADPNDFPMTAPVRHTALFAPTFSGDGVVRIHDVLNDPRYGGNPSDGVPAGKHPPVRSYLATPVLTQAGESLGALLFAHSRPGVFDEESEAAAQAVAAHAAVAIENAHLFATEQAVANRLQLLQSITAMLSTASSTSDIAQMVPPSVREVIGASGCSILLRDEATGALTSHTGRTAPESWQREVMQLIATADTPLRTVIETREPIYLTVDQVKAVPALSHLDFGTLSAVMVTPLLARDRRVLGILAATWQHGAGIGEQDQDLVLSVAAQVAQALERAQLFDAEQAAREQLAGSVAALTELARGLQRGLLPHKMPTLERVDVAVRYLPAVAGAEVGGDWYDVITTDGKVAFVIGDVQGHSTAAAGLMGQLRTAVRAYVSEGHSPGAALARTNQVVVDLGGNLFATCCLAQLDQRTGELVVASAGHPAPLLIRCGGALSEIVVDPGVPLGIEDATSYEETRMALTRRTQMLMYTDGVVESPSAGIGPGVETLGRIASQAYTEGCEVIADKVMAGIAHRLSDDAALLVLDYAGPAATQAFAALDFDASAQAPAECRRFLRRQLPSWEIGQDTVDTAELVVSELVTNAVVHTQGPARFFLEYDRDNAALRLSVQDSSTQQPMERPADDEALGGRGVHIVALVARDWGVDVHATGKTVWAELVLH